MTTAHSWLWTWRIAIGCLALVTAWLPLRPAAALVPLTDGPEHFDVFFACPSALPGTCFGAETDARRVAGFLETAWDAYEGMGLPLPDLDAEVVESIDEDGRIFAELSLRAAVAAEDGSDVIRASAGGPVDRAVQLGKDLAAELLELGAGDLVNSP